VKILCANEVFYLAIRYSGNCIMHGNILDRDYEYDRDRNSSPSQRNVFSLCSIKSKKIALSFAIEGLRFYHIEGKANLNLWNLAIKL